MAVMHSKIKVTSTTKMKRTLKMNMEKMYANITKQLNMIVDWERGVMELCDA